jgi:hypothetical protein
MRRLSEICLLSDFPILPIHLNVAFYASQQIINNTSIDIHSYGLGLCDMCPFIFDTKKADMRDYEIYVLTRDMNETKCLKKFRIFALS